MFFAICKEDSYLLFVAYCQKKEEINMGETVIVGGGIAGMTAAICLAEAGARVTVLEKTDRVGGNLCGWERRGHLIDNCLHWLCGTKRGTSLRALWERIGLLDDATALKKTPYFY